MLLNILNLVIILMLVLIGWCIVDNFRKVTEGMDDGCETEEQEEPKTCKISESDPEIQNLQTQIDQLSSQMDDLVQQQADFAQDLAGDEPVEVTGTDLSET